MDDKSLNVACIIPARGGSKGIPGKNIRTIAGKPMLQWSIEQAKCSPSLNHEIFVTSDSSEILDVATSCGAKAILRPEELSGDLASSESAIKHAVETIEAERGDKLDYIVFLQATSPVRNDDDIEKAIQLFLAEDADSLLSVCPLQDYFLWDKVDGNYTGINFDYKNRKRRQDIPETYLENGSLYIFKRNILFEENNRLGGKISVYPMDKKRSHQIDNEEDILFCEFILSREY
jgi:N-acylneuraminate cytidylyltransferase